jgi:hypothetical protein
MMEPEQCQKVIIEEAENTLQFENLKYERPCKMQGGR